MRKPAMRRGVELPEFADLSALPAAHGRQNFFGRDGMSELVREGPAADLGAVELEGVQAEGFGSGEAVRTRWRAGQPFFEQVRNGLRPRGGMIATGSPGRPERLWFAGACGVVSCGQSVKAAGGEAELRGGLDGTPRVLPECVKHMADEGGSVAMMELLILFKDPQNTRRPWLHHQSSRRASLRSPSSKTGGAAREIPGLLTTAFVLVCSPRERGVFAGFNCFKRVLRKFL